MKLFALALVAIIAASCGSGGSPSQQQALNVALWITQYGMVDVKTLQGDFQASANALSNGLPKVAKANCTKLAQDTSAMLKQPLPKAEPIAKDWKTTVTDSNTFASQCLSAIATNSSSEASQASNTAATVTDDITIVSNDIGELVG